jgi:hypothetical protein
LFTAIGGAFALFLLAETPALAQQRELPPVPPFEGSLPRPPGNGTDVIPTAITRDNTSGSRLNRQTNEERRQAERRRRAARGEAIAPTAATRAQILEAAQALATSAGLECRVTEASLLGVNPQEAPVYEAVCAEGPGQLMIASTPAQIYSCFELAGAPAGQQCAMPANQNSLAVIGGWARQSGVTCQIDQAAAIGRSTEGNLIYEVGCADADGYWLEKAADGWRLQSCEVITASGETCRFSEDRG